MCLWTQLSLSIALLTLSQLPIVCLVSFCICFDHHVHFQELKRKLLMSISADEQVFLLVCLFGTLLSMK